MLEETLKEISINLKRIADSMEGKKNEGPQLAMDQVPMQTTAPVAPQQSIAEPVTPVVNPVIPQPVPVVPTAQTTFTQQQLAVAMSNAVANGKQNTIMEVLAEFGVQALTQIDPSQYNNLAAKLKEKGIEV